MVPTAYEGKEKYIFVSYAHSDKEEVFKVLSELESHGYRFWYDAGIAPGSEWPEDIANHLNASYAVVAFITPRSVASHNCRREINYALSKNKHFLSVIMEPTEMSAGLEMQLSAQQSVIRYNYADWDAFINKIMTSPYIEPCRCEPAADDAASSAADTVDAADPASPEVVTEAGTSPSDTADAAAASSAAKDAAEKRQFGKKDKKTAGKRTLGAAQTSAVPKKGNNKKNMLVIGCAAVLLLAAILIYSAITTVTTSWGKDYKTSESYLKVEGAVFQQDDIDKLSRLSNVSDLTLVECDFSGCSASQLLSSFPECEYVRIVDCKGIDDYSFLNTLSLNTLQINGDPEFTDLSIVDPERLYHLNVSRTGVSDITPMAGASNLSDLDISNTEVSDIGAIAGLDDLKELNISGCKLKNTDIALKFLSLKVLNVSDCDLSDLSAFSNCTVLEKVDISGNPDIKDLSWLNGQNTGTLKEFSAAETGLDASSLEYIAMCSNISLLELDGVSLENLDFCKDHSSLEYISAQGCGLTDVSGLYGCSSLKTVLLSFNDISDFGGLTSLAPSDDGYDIKLDLSFNSLTDVSKLPAGAYHTLLLAGNDKKLASTLSADIKAYNVSLDYYDGILKSSFAGKDNFYYVYIIGTPDDQFLNVQDGLTYYHAVPVTMDQFYTETLTSEGLSYDPDIDFSYAVSLYEAQK